MEKFGIFELLDALSALTARENEKAEEHPAAEDGVFQPPTYGTADPLPEKERTAGADALSNFYARHEAVAKKANKKP